MTTLDPLIVLWDKRVDRETWGRALEVFVDARIAAAGAREPERATVQAYVEAVGRGRPCGACSSTRWVNGSAGVLNATPCPQCNAPPPEQPQPAPEPRTTDAAEAWRLASEHGSALLTDEARVRVGAPLGDEQPAPEVREGPEVWVRLWSDGRVRHVLDCNSQTPPATDAVRYVPAPQLDRVRAESAARVRNLEQQLEDGSQVALARIASLERKLAEAERKADECAVDGYRNGERDMRESAASALLRWDTDNIGKQAADLVRALPLTAPAPVEGESKGER